MDRIRPRTSSVVSLALAMVACSTGSSSAASSTAEADLLDTVRPRAQAAPGRVVAVGDLHGDLQQALVTLRLAGLVNGSGHWSGGSTTLVQTGDITDRGPDSRALIDLLQQLTAEAHQQGGRVVALLGNHEAMNLTGDWRYVHPGDVAAFGGAEARRTALALDAPYGAWLAERPAVARLADTIFVHGGVRAQVAEQGIEAINRRVRSGLRGGPDAELLGPDGPLWFRGYVTEPESSACAELGQALQALDATRMVVGHTTRRDGRIQTRCGGKLHVIDIGIASTYGGNAGAWVLEAGDAVAVYPSRREDLEDPT